MTQTAAVKDANKPITDKTRRVRWKRQGTRVVTSLETISVADIDQLINAHNHELCNLQQIVDILQMQLKKRK